MTTWHILTGEYPPQPGGVSDYTRLVAAGLAVEGDDVHVWAPDCGGETPEDAGVAAHRLPGCFGAAARREVTAALGRQRGPFQLLVQYVPQMYGCRGMNVPFCRWLWRHRHLRPWVMFHEVCFPLGWKQPFRHNVLGLVTRYMGRLVLGAAGRAFVSIPRWEPLLRGLRATPTDIQWLPVPSNLPDEVDPQRVARVRGLLPGGSPRRLVGHFGSYGSIVTAELLPVILPLLREDNSCHALLVGRGSLEFRGTVVAEHPELAGRLHATGGLDPEDAADHLSACDLLVQPYVDGVSSRRGSLMAGLALGVPVVTTTGPATEPVWGSGLVDLSPVGDFPGMLTRARHLLAHEAERRELGACGREGYRRYFSLEHTVRTLRQCRESAESPQPVP